MLADFLLVATLVGHAPAADSPGDAKPLSYELDYDFRGSRPMPPGFQLAGAVQNAVVRPEPGGFRITLAGDQPNPIGRVGLEMHTTLHGDFELTAGYELLRAEEPTDGYGVGFELYAHTVHQPQQGLGVYRLARVDEGDVYLVSRSYFKEDGAQAWDQAHFRTTARSGRLRIRRSGAEATALAAEGIDDSFKELRRNPLGRDDIKVIWLMAYTGHAQYPLDLRITELKIRSGVPLPSQPAVAVAEPDVLPRPKLWLILTLALLLTLLLVALVWFFTRRRAADGED